MLFFTTELIRPNNENNFVSPAAHSFFNPVGFNFLDI